MKKLLSAVGLFLFAISSAQAYPIIGTVQTNAPTTQSGGFNIQKGTITQSLSLTYLSSGLCTTTDSNGKVINTPSVCGINLSSNSIAPSPQYSVPYYSAVSSNILNGSLDLSVRSGSLGGIGVTISTFVASSGTVTNATVGTWQFINSADSAQKSSGQFAFCQSGHPCTQIQSDANGNSVLSNAGFSMILGNTGGTQTGNITLGSVGGGGTNLTVGITGAVSMSTFTASSSTLTNLTITGQTTLPLTNTVLAVNSAGVIVSTTVSGGGGGSGPSGQINNATQGYIPFYSVTGSSNVLSGSPGISVTTITVSGNSTLATVSVSTLTMANAIIAPNGTRLFYIDPSSTSVYLGYDQAGNPPPTGNYNTATGNGSLNVLTTGQQNSAFGWSSLAKITTTTSHSGFGYQALLNTTTGYGDTGFGYLAGSVNNGGSYNSFFGYGSNSGSDNLSNATAIGANAIVQSSNTIQLGGTGANAVTVNASTMTVSSMTVTRGNLYINSDPALATGGNKSTGTITINTPSQVTSNGSLTYNVSSGTTVFPQFDLIVSSGDGSTNLTMSIKGHSVANSNGASCVNGLTYGQTCLTSSSGGTSYFGPGNATVMTITSGTFTTGLVSSSGTILNGNVAFSSTVVLNGSAGTNGQVYTSGGPGASPSWTTVSGTNLLPSTNTFTGGNTFKSSTTFSSDVLIGVDAGAGGFAPVRWDQTNGVFVIGGPETDSNPWLNINAGSAANGVTLAMGSASEGILYSTNTAVAVEPTLAQNSNDSFYEKLQASRQGLLISVQPTSDSTFIPLKLNASDSVNNVSVVIRSTGVTISSDTYINGTETINGTGDGAIILTIGASTYSVTSSSVTPVVGNMAVFTSTNGTLGNGGTPAVGTITQVIAGTGLTGGGSSGAVTLTLGTTVAFTNSTQTYTAQQTFNASVAISTTATIRSLTEGTTSWVYGSSSTITPDARLGNNIAIVLHSSATINVPANASDRQMFRFFIDQDSAGSRTVTLGSGFQFGTDVTSLSFSTAANAEDIFGCIFRSSNGKCNVINNSLRGY